MALVWQERLVEERQELLSTEFVLVEITDSLAAVHFRKHAVAIINLLIENPYVEIVPSSSGLFAEALELKRRMDKGWGLTDCTSFIVRHRYGVTEALTTDEFSRQVFECCYWRCVRLKPSCH